MKSKTEIKLQSELRESINKICPNWFYYKIADAPVYKGSKSRFTPSKPFDIIILSNKHTFGIETKVHKSNYSFPLSRISENQMENLYKINKIGAKGLVIINHRLGKGKERINNLYVLPIGYILYLIDNNKKSIKLNAPFIDGYTPMIIKWKKIWDKYYWDIERLNLIENYWIDK